MNIKHIVYSSMERLQRKRQLHQPTRAQSKKTILKAWNNIAIDFHQEMGQEYSTIVQIIVKAVAESDCVTLSKLWDDILLYTRRKNSSDS